MAEKLYSYADKQVMDEVGAGGGGGQESRKCIITANSPNDVTCNMTASELMQFLNDGNVNIVLKLNSDSNFILHSCTQCIVQSDTINLQFLEVNTVGNTLVLYYVIFDLEKNSIELGIVNYELTTV